MVVREKHYSIKLRCRNTSFFIGLIYDIISMGDIMSLIIGSHVSFNSKTQLLGAVKEALSYNANTFMIIA